MNQPLSITIAESPLLPDQIARAGIRHLCKKRLNQEFFNNIERASERYQQVLNDLRSSQLAIDTDKANEQHYELPTAFFQAVLGPRLKYSASFFADGDNLADAENRSLKIYSERAKLNDGLHILELGCGWGLSHYGWLKNTQAPPLPQFRILTHNDCTSWRKLKPKALKTSMSLPKT
jgi:cyclopropane-fatty-acyl-phospholipid synthase